MSTRACCEHICNLWLRSPSETFALCYDANGGFKFRWQRHTCRGEMDVVVAVHEVMGGLVASSTGSCQCLLSCVCLFFGHHRSAYPTSFVPLAIFICLPFLWRLSMFGRRGGSVSVWRLQGVVSMCVFTQRMYLSWFFLCMVVSGRLVQQIRPFLGAFSGCRAFAAVWSWVAHGKCLGTRSKRTIIQCMFVTGFAAIFCFHFPLPWSGLVIEQWTTLLIWRGALSCHSSQCPQLQMVTSLLNFWRTRIRFHLCSRLEEEFHVAGVE